MHSSLFSARALVRLMASHSSARFPQTFFTQAAHFSTDTTTQHNETTEETKQSTEAAPKSAKKPMEKKAKKPTTESTANGEAGTKQEATPKATKPRPSRKKVQAKTDQPNMVELSEAPKEDAMTSKGSDRVTTISSVVPTLDGAALDTLISTTAATASEIAEHKASTTDVKKENEKEKTPSEKAKKPVKSRSTRNLVTDTSFLKTEQNAPVTESTATKGALPKALPSSVLQQVSKSSAGIKHIIAGAKEQIQAQTEKAVIKTDDESADSDESKQVVSVNADADADAVEGEIEDELCGDEAGAGKQAPQARLTASELKQQQISIQQAADRSRFRERMVSKADGGMEYHGMPPQLADKYPDPPRLTVDIAPRNLKVQNVRLLMKKKYWEQLRKEQHERCKYRCEICGGMGDRWPVELHEKWSFDDQNRRLKLLGMTSLCPLCHLVKHANLAKMQGKLEEVIEHLAGVNNWSLDESRVYVDYSLDMWAVRSKLSWQTDLSVVHKYIFVSKSDAKS